MEKKTLFKKWLNREFDDKKTYSATPIIKMPTMVYPTMDSIAKDIMLIIMKDPYPYIDEVRPETIDTVAKDLAEVSFKIAREFSKESKVYHDEISKKNDEKMFDNIQKFKKN